MQHRSMEGDVQYSRYKLIHFAPNMCFNHTGTHYLIICAAGNLPKEYISQRHTPNEHILIYIHCPQGYKKRVCIHA